MGLLVEGKWQDQWSDTSSSGGQFKRQASSFRHWVTADGSAGPSGDDGFKAEKIVIIYTCHSPALGHIAP